MFTLGEKIMSTISVTNLRENIYKIIENINKNSDQVLITNSKGKGAVLISEDDWNAISETLYLDSQKGLRESIIKMSKEKLSKAKPYNKDEEW